ncbi:unnamed protein product [Toxocara canis]|uniref:P-type domain-containing protein n=1 Tax=Toxocara canis TaxID=6265 RepID=A0A183ULW3_TOXCA|nr:unnamed protein product [Toxocara canis]
MIAVPSFPTTSGKYGQMVSEGVCVTGACEREGRLKYSSNCLLTRSSCCEGHCRKPFLQRFNPIYATRQEEEGSWLHPRRRLSNATLQLSWILWDFITSVCCKDKPYSLGQELVEDAVLNVHYHWRSRIGFVCLNHFLCLRMKKRAYEHSSASNAAQHAPLQHAEDVGSLDMLT